MARTLMRSGAHSVKSAPKADRAVSRITYTSTEARTHWGDIMDASQSGVPVTIGRKGSAVSAVTDAERLRAYLAETLEPRALTFSENGVYAIVLDRRGFASEGETLDAAIDDMIVQLREYAEDWEEHFSAAPNHQGNWPLVQLLSISSDDQIRDWLIGGSN